MNRETQNIEFKESWRDEYLIWICGFANAQGGSLFVGIRDNGDVCEVEDAKKLMEDIPNKVRDLMGILVEVNLSQKVKTSLDILITKYLRALISYEGIQRIESLPMPREALREALLNCVVHKAYESLTPIQIAVYDNKLEIWNCGVLPEDWTIDNLLGNHRSRPYNPDIANAFFRAGEIEAWGRGIDRIIEACKSAGTPEPQFKYDGGGLWTTFFSAKNIKKV